MQNTVKQNNLNSIKLRSGMVIGTKDFHMILFAVFYAFLFVFTDFGIDIAYGIIFLSIAESIYFVFNFNRLSRFNASVTSIFIYFFALVVIVMNFRSAIFISQVPLYVFGMALTTISLLYNDKDYRARKTVLKIILLSAFINALVVYFSRIAPDIYLNLVRGFTIERYNRLKVMIQQGYSGYLVQEPYALYMMIMGCCICALQLYCSGKKSRKKFWRCALFVFLAVAVILVNRRGELLSAIAAGIITVFIVGKKRTRRIIISLFAAGLVLLLLLAMLIKSGVVHYEGNNRLILTFFDVIKGKDISNGRNDLYEVALNIFKDNMWLGIGWGEFRRYSTGVFNFVSNVHCIYLQLLCETGIIGALVIYTALIYVLYKFYKNFKSAKDSTLKSSCIFSLFMFILILVHGIIDNPIYYDTFWFLLGILMFCSYRTGSKAVK